MRISTKSLLIILVIFLFGTNVAVVVTYRLHLRSEVRQEESTITVPDSQLGRFFMDELNLNAAQQDRFREFRRNYNRSAGAVMREMQSIRYEMIQELNAVHPNREKLDNLAGQIGQKHKELKILTFDYYFNMQSVLDEEQQGKMVKIFQAMLTEEGDAKTTVPGNQGHRGQGQGRGQGWHHVADSLQNNQQ